MKVMDSIKRFYHELHSIVKRIVTDTWFDRIGLTAILLNSLILAMIDYSVVNNQGVPIENGSWRNTLAVESDIYFIIYFTVEMILKVFALGFYGGDSSYMSDSWNWLDFIVVISG